MLVDTTTTTTTRAHLREALVELRAITGTAAPITHVILTHAHTDHIGGLDEVRAPGVEVIAQAGFPDELRLQHASPPILFRPADPSGQGRWLDIVPDRLRLVDYGLLRHADDRALQGLRRRLLYRLLERYQQLSPFKFAIYAATAGVEVPPAP